MEFFDQYPLSADISLHRERLQQFQERLDYHFVKGYNDPLYHMSQMMDAKKRVFGCRPLYLNFDGISTREKGPIPVLPRVDVVTAFLTRRQFFRAFSLHGTISRLFSESFVNLRSWTYERRGDIDGFAQASHDDGKFGEGLSRGLAGARSNDGRMQSFNCYSPNSYQNRSGASYTLRIFGGSLGSIMSGKIAARPWPVGWPREVSNFNA